MSERIVTVENANVQTALIQINQLTIGGTQKMNQKIFRQIKRESIIDFENGCLKGTPWGIVNYFWASNARFKDSHLHLLWQNGEELRRCFIYPTGYRDEYGQFIIGKEDDMVTKTVYPNQFDSDLVSFTYSFSDKHISQLYKTMGIEMPVLEILPLGDFHIKMEKFLVIWKKTWSTSNKWEVKTTLNKTYDTIRNHFWGMIEELFPEVAVKTKEMNAVGWQHANEVYKLYMHNRVHPCNRLIKDIIKTTPQVYV